MLLISFAIFIDILKKGASTPNAEEVITTPGSSCFDIGLFKKVVTKPDDCFRIVLKLIKGSQTKPYLRSFSQLLPSNSVLFVTRLHDLHITFKGISAPFLCPRRVVLSFLRR